jgi:hypothetical protein
MKVSIGRDAVCEIVAPVWSGRSLWRAKSAPQWGSCRVICFPERGGDAVQLRGDCRAHLCRSLAKVLWFSFEKLKLLRPKASKATATLTLRFDGPPIIKLLSSRRRTSRLLVALPAFL